MGSGLESRSLSTPSPGQVTEQPGTRAESPLEAAPATAGPGGPPRKGRGRGRNGGATPSPHIRAPATSGLRVGQTPRICVPGVIDIKQRGLDVLGGLARPHFPPSGPKDP